MKFLLKFGLMSLVLIINYATPILAQSHNNPSDAHSHSPLDLESPLKKVVVISESGAAPERIKLEKLDASIFFLNSTKDSLLTLRIDFSNKQPHCASSNLRYDRATKKIQSVQPIGPKDFALLCFPERSEYQVEIYGVGSKTKPINVIVEVGY